MRTHFNHYKTILKGGTEDMMSILNYLRIKFAGKKGQGLVEYGLILGVIAVIVVAALTFLSEPLKDLFENVGEFLTSHDPNTAG